jgi:hypothetical protein
MGVHLIFVILVVLGFVFQFVATWPVPQFPWSARLAWGCWLVAALLWALAGADSAATTK